MAMKVISATVSALASLTATVPACLLPALFDREETSATAITSTTTTGGGGGGATAVECGVRIRKTAAVVLPRRRGIKIIAC